MAQPQAKVRFRIVCRSPVTNRRNTKRLLGNLIHVITHFMNNSSRRHILISNSLLGVFGALWGYSIEEEVSAGFLHVWIPMGGEFTFTRSSEPGPFYFWLVIDIVSIGSMLAISIATPFMLRSKHGPAFERSYLALANKLAPSGLRPLWIGLLLAIMAFSIYVMA